LPYPQFPVALGVLFAVDRPTYGTTLAEQRETARTKYGASDMQALLHSGHTWTV
jgi:hypothetical protein